MWLHSLRDVCTHNNSMIGKVSLLSESIPFILFNPPAVEHNPLCIILLSFSPTDQLLSKVTLCNCVYESAYLWAVSVRAADNPVHAAQLCELIGGHRREAHSLAHCPPPGPRPPSPSAEEPDVAQLSDHGQQSLQSTHTMHDIHDFNMSQCFLYRTSFYLSGVAGVFCI